MNMSSITFYMIQDAKTGKFSSGGSYHNWVEQDSGKMWRKLGHARASITNAKKYARFRHHTPDYHIIKFTVPASSGVDEGSW